MGFTIFETNGTFNPANYGLKVGDILHVVCVGGGGSGAAYNMTSSGSGTGKNGNAGTASSFGSIVTASGGAGGTYNGNNSTQGGFIGGQGVSSSTTNATSNSGGGAGGWYPNLLNSGGPGLPGIIGSDSIFINTLGGCGSYCSLTASSQAGTALGGGFGVAAGKGSAYMTAGSGSINGKGAAGGYAGGHSNGYACCGGGGAGYGAGGGAAHNFGQPGAQYYYCNGGNSGQILQVETILSSLESISITVGSGGAAVTPSGSTHSGAGAAGCVAIFW